MDTFPNPCVHLCPLVPTCDSVASSTTANFDTLSKPGHASEATFPIIIFIIIIIYIPLVRSHGFPGIHIVKLLRVMMLMMVMMWCDDVMMKI